MLATVTATRGPFIVVALGDRDSFGFSDRTFPALVALVDAHSPDHRDVRHPGVMAYFRASAEAARRVQSLVEAAEQLRKHPEFASLGIGIASGPLIADLAAGMTPLGTTANDASRLSMSAPDAYIDPFNVLLREYRLA